MEKSLKSLNRKELIEIIYKMKKEEQELSEENESLKRQLADRRIKISEAGSIAEASIALSEVFSAAQDAADRYLEELDRRKAELTRDYVVLIKHAQSKADAIVKNAELQRDQITAQTRKMYVKLKNYEAAVENIKRDYPFLNGQGQGNNEKQQEND